MTCDAILPTRIWFMTISAKRTICLSVYQNEFPITKTLLKEHIMYSSLQHYIAINKHRMPFT